MPKKMMDYSFAQTDVQPMNSAVAVKSLESAFSNEITKMKKKAEVFAVVDQQTMNTAIEMTNQAKKLINAIEKEKNALKRPALDYTQPIDAMVRNLKKPIAEIQAILNEKIKPVALEIQRAEQKRLQKEAKERARIEAANANKVVKTPVMAPPVAPTKAAAGTFKTNAGSVTVKTFKKWTVVDIQAVPRKYKYWAIDEDFLNRDVQNGVKVPGLKIEDDIDLKTRVSKS